MILKIIFSILVLVFFISCQESASSNRIISECPATAFLKYPLKTGQNDTFMYEDITYTPPIYYYDDGDIQNRKGYERDFTRYRNGTVYNENYNLYWQDNEALQEGNFTLARAYCQSLSLAGKTDWRLPNLYEMGTLLDLGSRSDLRESSFINMPAGMYFSSNEIYGTDSTYVMSFMEDNISITKIDKVHISNVLGESDEYGILIGRSQVPYFNNDGILINVVETEIYYKRYDQYDELVNIKTTLETITQFSVLGASAGIFGPYVTETLECDCSTCDNCWYSTVTLEKAYVKCVSGPEINGFSFIRDDKKAVVVDRATNLVWQDSRDIVEKNFQWGGAVQYCKELSLGEYKDWRVPTITELLTIVDFQNNGTHAVDDTFLYKSANKFHSSSNLCYGADCRQKNLQLNACGYLDEKITQNIEVDKNPYDLNNTEPYYKVRCVRCGSY